MPLAPEVVFFPPSHCPILARGHYAAAINLSARPEAAACLAGLEAGLKLGPAALPDGLHVHGFWQLYRTALTQNNHHNAFHWSDLYRLDLESAVRPGQAGHILPKGAGSGRVALVLGASEAAKRPDALFWARLARRLAGAGAMPVFLGGPAESALGQEVARLAQLPHANLCGRLPLRDVAAVLRGLDLCITPDTGPMHLADWLGVPVLNLSMGPVHARETGPTAPGQWVLRAAMSCGDAGNAAARNCTVSRPSARPPWRARLWPFWKIPRMPVRRPAADRCPACPSAARAAMPWTSIALKPWKIRKGALRRAPAALCWRISGRLLFCFCMIPHCALWLGNAWRPWKMPFRNWRNAWLLVWPAFARNAPTASSSAAGSCPQTFGVRNRPCCAFLPDIRICFCKMPISRRKAGRRPWTV